MLFSKTSLSGAEVNLQKLNSTIQVLEVTFFILKDRIHPKVPKHWHQNFDSELSGCKKVRIFFGCENGSELREKVLMKQCAKFSAVVGFMDSFEP